jgi:hypothetical protein
MHDIEPRPLTDAEIEVVVGGFVPMDPVGLTAALVKTSQAFAEFVGGPLVRNAGLPTL